MDSLSGLALHTSLLQCLVVWVTAVSGAPKASVWVVVMYTMNNHTTGYKRVKSKAFVNSWQECMWRGYHIYITAKTHIACFTHEVVTLVADKLRRQWLWDLTLLTACIMQPESQLPWCKQHGTVLQTITIILTILKTSVRESLQMYLILSNSKYLSCSYIVQAGDSLNHRC